MSLLRHRVRGAALLAIAVSVLGSAARAETSGADLVVRPQELPKLRVLVVSDGSTQELVARLQGELLVWGWESRESRQVGESLPTLGQASDCWAVLRLSNRGSSIEMWVADPRTAKTVVEETLSALDPTTENVTAVRIAETLRARLVRLGLVVDEQELPPPPAPVLNTDSARKAPRPRSQAIPTREGAALRVGLAAALGYSSSSIGPMALALPTLRIAVDRHWSLEGFGVWPLASNRLESDEGAAIVSLRSAGVVASFAATHGRWELGVGGGVAATWLSIVGEENPLYDGHDLTLAMPAALGHWLLTMALSRSVRVRLDARVGTTFKRNVIRFGERNVATWGQPFAGFAVGPEIDFGP